MTVSDSGGKGRGAPKDGQSGTDPRWWGTVTASLLQGLAQPLKISETETVPHAQAARPDQLLPVLMLEAASVWENISGEQIVAGLAPDPFARLGVRATDGLRPVPLTGDPEPLPPVPATVVLACLTEAAESASDGQAIRLDHLMQRWEPKLAEVRQRPAP